MKTMGSHDSRRWPRVQAMTQLRPHGGSVSILLIGLLLLMSFAASRISLADDEQQIGPAPGNDADQHLEWRFRVFLDDRLIGYHDFTVTREGASQAVRSIADFEYKLLFVKLYDYEHENSENWHGDCLQSIQSSTNANAKPFSVQGQLQSDRFVIHDGEGETVLPPCIMTFAYWNPRILDQEQLLNSQNGEYLRVNTSQPVKDSFRVRGELLEAF